MSKLEQVAEAMVAAEEKWLEENPLQRSCPTEVIARAALEEMKKPTELMFRACWENHHPWGKNAPPPEERADGYAAMKELVGFDWTAMIDHILSETKP